MHKDAINKNELLEEMTYIIADVINTDISYISSENKNGYQYLTGIEFGMLLAAGISSLFFVPFIAGFSNKLGESLAEATVVKLKTVATEIKIQVHARKIKKELNEKLEDILTDEMLSMMHSVIRDDNNEQLKLIVYQQLEEVKGFLRDNHFPEEKLDSLSKEICETIYNLYK